MGSNHQPTDVVAHSYSRWWSLWGRGHALFISRSPERVRGTQYILTWAKWECPCTIFLPWTGVVSISYSSCPLEAHGDIMTSYPLVGCGRSIVTCRQLAVDWEEKGGNRIKASANQVMKIKTRNLFNTWVAASRAFLSRATALVRGKSSGPGICLELQFSTGLWISSMSITQVEIESVVLPQERLWPIVLNLPEALLLSLPRKPTCNIYPMSPRRKEGKCITFAILT